MSPILIYISRVIDVYLHEPYTSLLKGVTYGIPIQLGPLFTQQIRHSGLTHLVVLSGANITILVAATELLFTRLGKRVGILLNFLFVGGFTLIVGLQAPLLRALIMFACSSICILTGRPSYIWWNLWLSVFFTAVCKPEWITTISFILSLVATVGLILSDGVIQKVPFKLPEIGEECVRSMVVFLFTLPISVFFFHSFSVVSPFATAAASILILPLMAGGLILPVAHLVFPPLAIVVSYLLSGLLICLHIIIERSAAVPFGYFQWK